MNTHVLILLGTLIFILVIMVLIGNIKRKSYLKGYKQAEFDVTASLFSTATWFSSKPIFYNTLYLFAIKYRNKGSVSSDIFREEILKLDTKKRITDLPKEEYDRLCN